MEHPFLVEEYIPAQAQRAPSGSREFGTAITEPESAPALPPFSNLKSRNEISAGMIERGERKRTADDVSKAD
jgi:hypothetical protein